jgi:hypothetical protein
MAFDFPSSPAEGAIYAPPGGPQYQFTSGVWKQVAATGEVLNIVRTVITTSQSYNKPEGLKFLEVICVGAGGGSVSIASQAASNVRTSSGGGGGGTTIQLYAAADLAASESITIGVGTVQAAGGATLFKGLSGGGGNPGTVTTSTTTATAVFTNGGSGGGGSGGTINMAGGRGEAGASCPSGILVGYAGGGGGTFFAGSIAGRYVSTENAVGGNIPGGGATGCAARNAEGAANGAAGGNGRVYLTEYF